MQDKSGGSTDKTTGTTAENTIFACRKDIGSIGFSAGQADYTDIAVDGAVNPFVVYQDYGNSWNAK